MPGKGIRMVGRLFEDVELVKVISFSCSSFWGGFNGLGSGSWGWGDKRDGSGGWRGNGERGGHNRSGGWDTVSYVQGGGADWGEWVKQSRGEGGDRGGHTDSVMNRGEGHSGGGGESESGDWSWGRGQAEGDGGGWQELPLLPLLPDHLPASALLPIALPVDHLATIPPHPDHVTEALAWEGFVSLCERGQAEDGG